MSKRNLNRERIYYDSLDLLKILGDLGIEIDMKLHRSPLRRFVIGEKMERIETPVERVHVSRNKEIQVPMDLCTGLDEFFDSFRKGIETKISDSGILEESISQIELCEDFEFGITSVLVYYKDLETDTEYNLRNDRAKKFNEILSFKDEIYRRIDLLKGKRNYVIR